MRTSTVSQSIALAFGLVGALGFLGYTTLSPHPQSADAQPAPSVVQPLAPQPPVSRPVAVEPKVAQEPTSPVDSPLPAPQPDVARAAPALEVAHAVAVIAAVQPVAPQALVNHPVPKVAAMPPAQPVLTPAWPPRESASVQPVAPLGAMSEAVALAPEKPLSRRALARQRQKEAQAAARAAKLARVAAPPLPVAARYIQPVTIAPREVPAPKAVAVAVAAPAPAAVVPAPKAAPAPVLASSSSSSPFSKDEMTVTVSGKQAWVQVSPTRTMAVRKGDVLPNLGKILEIKSNEVVAEKGTLTTN